MCCQAEATGSCTEAEKTTWAVGSRALEVCYLGVQMHKVLKRETLALGAEQPRGPEVECNLCRHSTVWHLSEKDNKYRARLRVQ